MLLWGEKAHKYKDKHKYKKHKYNCPSAISHLGRGSHAQPSTHCRRDVVENIDNFFFGILQLYRSQGWRNFTTLLMDGRNRYFSLRLFTSCWSTRSPESSSPPTGGSFFTRIESHLWQRSVRHQQQQQRV